MQVVDDKKSSAQDTVIESKEIKVVEERRSARGYKFSVVNVDDTLDLSEVTKDDDDWGDETLDAQSEEDTQNDSRRRSRSRSRSQSRVTGERDGGYQSRRAASPLRSTSQRNFTAFSATQVGPVPSAAPVKSLIDVWSQVGAQSDAADDSGSLALNLIDASGAIPDAAPYTRLIQEQARAAAAGDKRALDKAFKVCLMCIRVCVCVCVCTYVCVCFLFLRACVCIHGCPRWLHTHYRYWTACKEQVPLPICSHTHIHTSTHVVN
jgi:hypothetical protein